MAKSLKRRKPRGESKKVPPAFKTISLAPEATSYHFYTGKNWARHKEVKNSKSVKAVMSKMKEEGLFTAVIMRGAKTTCVGVAEGTTKGDKFILSNVDRAENCLVTNGGFFITGGDSQLRLDYKPNVPINQKGTQSFPAESALLDSSSVMYYSVGPTSVSPNYVPVPGALADLYHKMEGDDGSFLTCGPDLVKDNVKEPPPPHGKTNTMAGRLHYFVKDINNEKIHSPVWDEQVMQDKKVYELEKGQEGVGLKSELEHDTAVNRPTFSDKAVTWCDKSVGKTFTNKITPVRSATDGSSEFIRSVFAHIPGGIATANEPNERNVLVCAGNDVKVVCTYTSKRKAGMKLSEMRDVIDVFLKNFLGDGIDKADMALNLDGGPSIFVGWLNDGKLQLLAAGAMEKQKVAPSKVEGHNFRDVTTMIKHLLESPLDEAEGTTISGDTKKTPGGKRRGQECREGLHLKRR